MTSVRPNSLGACAAIRHGDSVTEIGDRPVHSAQEIDAAVGSSSTAKVRYMIRRNWLAIHDVKLR